MPLPSPSPPPPPSPSSSPSPSPSPPSSSPPLAQSDDLWLVPNQTSICFNVNKLLSGGYGTARESLRKLPWQLVLLPVWKNLHRLRYN